MIYFNFCACDFSPLLRVYSERKKFLTQSALKKKKPPYLTGRKARYEPRSQHASFTGQAVNSCKLMRIYTTELKHVTLLTKALEYERRSQQCDKIPFSRNQGESQAILPVMRIHTFFFPPFFFGSTKRGKCGDSPRSNLRGLLGI